MIEGQAAEQRVAERGVAEQRVTEPQMTELRHGNDRGTATVELAIALAGIVLALSVVLAVVGVGLVRLDVQDAARVGARVAVTGADEGAVADAVSRAAGSGAVAHVVRSGEWVTVTVSRPLAGRWGTWTIEGRQTGWLETSVTDAAGGPAAASSAGVPGSEPMIAGP